MNTFSQKPSEVTRQWYVLDASDISLGRLSTAAASLLIGKAKPTITAHTDGGDYVIITNVASMKVTGNKSEGKVYHRYSGYPGGLKSRKLSEIKPEDAVYKAIRGMLPDNKLRDGRLKRLKIYAGAEHEHTAQKPQAYDLKKGSK